MIRSVIDGTVLDVYLEDVFEDVFKDRLFAIDIMFSDPENVNCAMSTVRVWFKCEDKNKKTHLAYNLKKADRVRVVCKKTSLLGYHYLVSINVFD